MDNHGLKILIILNILLNIHSAENVRFKEILVQFLSLLLLFFFNNSFMILVIHFIRGTRILIHLFFKFCFKL